MSEPQASRHAWSEVPHEQLSAGVGRRAGVMSEPQASLHAWSEVPHEQLSAGVGRRAIHAEGVTLGRFDLGAGAVVAKHAHEQEQLTSVLEGRLRVWLGEREEQCFDVAAGEVLLTPPHLPHRVEALEPTLALDVFTPRRQDWIEGADAYLRDR